MEFNASLEALAKLDLPDDLEQELRRAGKVGNEQAAKRIQELEEMLPEKEVQEVNELLLWVKGGFEYFNPEQREHLLTATRLYRDADVADTVPVTQSSEGEAQDMGFEGETISTQAISLLSLRERLLVKYPIFIIDQDGDVDLGSPEIREYLTQPDTNSTGRTSSESATWSRTPTKVEIDIIRHMLHNLCPRDL